MYVILGVLILAGSIALASLLMWWILPLGSWYVAPYLSKWLTQTQVMWLAVPAGVVAHIAVGVETPLNKMVVGPGSNVFAQAVSALMAYKGFSTKY